VALPTITSAIVGANTITQHKKAPAATEIKQAGEEKTKPDNLPGPTQNKMPSCVFRQC
jgi:hypothetical protein